MLFFSIPASTAGRKFVTNSGASLPLTGGIGEGVNQLIDAPTQPPPSRREERGKDLGRALLAAGGKAGPGGNGHFVLWRNAEYEPAAWSRNNPIIPFRKIQGWWYFCGSAEDKLPTQRKRPERVQ